jgi:hypothetical protein
MTNSTTSVRRPYATSFGDEFAPTEKRFARGSFGRKVKVFKRLGDSDFIPACKYFGRFQGKRLGEVPAQQLDKWRDAEWIDNLYPNVRDYIDRNASAIDLELRDSNRP